MSGPNNPPAFPLQYEDRTSTGVVHTVVSEGISQRALLAGMALQGQIQFEGMEGCDKQHMAAMACELADALMAELEKL